MTDTAPHKHEVIIIGAGVAGASAAYHLSKFGITDILVIDSGSLPGEGPSDQRRSGSAVMESAPTVKMMIQLYGFSSETFISHHGREGAIRYLNATREGLRLQTELAKEVLADPSDQLKELGSFYIGYPGDRGDLMEEFDTLRSLGCEDVEWYDTEMLRQVPGCPPGFDCAIFFPKDAIIDSSAYAKGLLRKAQEEGAVSLLLNTKVVRIAEENDTALVELDSGTVLRSKHVVVATGGLFQVPQLNGILKPCYSYLVHVPVDDDCEERCETSSNFFTWGFSHDWCFTRGKVRTSGEDDFSAYKIPKTEERCDKLIQWTLQKYASSIVSSVLDEIPRQHGVYSETPDAIPLIGSIDPDNNSVCYLLGCNALGQAMFSYASSLVPGLLGYRPLRLEERDNLRLLSIRRFSLLGKS